MSNNRLMGHLWMLTGLLIPVAIIGYATTNRIGPREFWATDVCPEPNVICGNFPLVIWPAVIIGAVMLGAGFYLAYPDYEVVE